MLLFFLFISTAKAQYQDFRSWWNVEISKELVKDLDLKIEASQRFKENSLEYDRSVITGRLAYELFKDFSVRAGYRYLIVKNEGILESRYRIHAGMQYGKKISSLSLSARERLQYGFDDQQSMQDFFSQKTVSRTRIKAAYEIFGTPLELHGAYELYLDLNSGYGILPEANRWQLGITYDFLKKGSIDISYLIENEVNTVNPLLSHIVLVTYSYDL